MMDIRRQRPRPVRQVVPAPRRQRRGRWSLLKAETREILTKWRWRRRIALTLVGAMVLGYLQSYQALQVEAAQTNIDLSAATTSQRGQTNGTNSVFTTDQIGYVFFADSAWCAYRKTSDGGTTWAAAIQIAPGCYSITVWYDRWTPGDTTGTNIYIMVLDSVNGNILYNKLDTSGDTLESGTTALDVTGTQAPSLGLNETASITKGTDGDLYLGLSDAVDGFVLKCTGTCGTAGNWTEAGTNPFTPLADDYTGLLPLAGGEIMAIRHVKSSDDLVYKIYSDSGNSWGGSNNIDTNGVEDLGAPYRALWHAVVDPMNNDIYLAYIANAATGSNDDDIRTAKFSGGSWTLTTDVITNTTEGLTGLSLALNYNNGDIYVVYSAQSTAGTASTGDVNWKKSSNGMTSWGSESANMNSAQGDLRFIHANAVSTDRLHVNWYILSTEDQVGDTMDSCCTPPTYEMSAYRLYASANSADVGTTLAALNTANALLYDAQAFRLRVLLHVGGDGARAGLNTFKLQYVDKGSGSCASPSGGTPASYTDMTTSTSIGYYDNASPADGASVTGNANDPTHSGHTIVNQTYEEANNFTLAAAIPTGQDGLWDFSLADLSAPAAVTYCFRVVKSDGTTIDTYTNRPEFATFGALPKIMRGGAWFHNETEQGLAW